MKRAYKFRIYPTEEQKIFLDKQMAGCRVIYNYLLGLKNQEPYELDGDFDCFSEIKGIEDGDRIRSKAKIFKSEFDLNKEITKFKKDKPWLNEIYTQPLQQESRHLICGFNNFFRGLKEHQNIGYPKFKKRIEKQSFSTVHDYRLNYELGEVILKRVGRIRAVFHRPLIGKLGTATFSKTPSGKYFVSILAEDGNPPVDKLFNSENMIGIDLGLRTFATFSDGAKIENPNYFRKMEKRISSLQHRKDKHKSCEKGEKPSNNHKKLEVKIATLHERVKSQRRDFLDKLSTTIVLNYSVIAVETLRVKNMVKNRHLSKKISDVGWGMFLGMLKYKCEMHGKTLIAIDTFAPSSKLCSICGAKNNELTLKDEYWVCKECNTKHDRDINAAQNIKSIALETYLNTLKTT